ncbi:10de04a2-fcb5-4ae7-99f3-c83f92eb1240 [Thermothielavioides terrestris]|uniref:10de04a2-fcb5-4ae7-99f3-c83f92eb1240 n=1 Tax=Thermothielavioides terrestris TaxID=2587410 RepID=A0A3S4F2J8_9PEZI|nr:10de04a2-fcb5-4ae7-99f3-c83f92eb1240 [Thermothielavioides terrestris]
MASCVSIAPEAILALASHVRNDGSSPAFCFGTEKSPLEGGEAVVYAVRFPDGVTWAVRVPVHAAKSLGPASLAAFMETQATMLTRLAKSGFRWSPKLVSFDCGFDNHISHPYFVLSWFDGLPLQWTDTYPPEPQVREKILRQIVDIRLELAECTKDLRPNASALAFLTRVVDGKIMRALTDEKPVFTPRDCFVHRALLPHVVHDALESEPSVFAISHEDLAAHNIIVDSEYNITGIVGWNFARVLPLQLAFRLPRFLAIEPDSPNETAPQTPEDIRAFATQFLQPSKALLTDRQYLTAYLATVIADASQPERAALAETMKSVLSDPDADWRYLVVEACFSKGMHAWLVHRDWLLHGTKGELADSVNITPDKMAREVDSFLDGEGRDEGLTREALLEAINSQ